MSSRKHRGLGKTPPIRSLSQGGQLANDEKTARFGEVGSLPFRCGNVNAGGHRCGGIEIPRRVTGLRLDVTKIVSDYFADIRFSRGPNPLLWECCIICAVATTRVAPRYPAMPPTCQPLRIPRAFLFLLSILLSVPASAQHLQAFSFNAASGSQPASDLVADSAGNLYGTAYSGGALGRGTVYEFTPPPTPGGAWTETTIYTFHGQPDGSNPNGGLVLDKVGDLYGTTQIGGIMGSGTVFELSPPSEPGGAWTETILYAFPGFPGDGGNPFAPVIIDTAGNLYGTTNGGGTGTFGAKGTAFELSPPSQPGGNWTESILYNFGAFQADGGLPEAALTFDFAGNLYGTTVAGGTSDSGTVFQLAPQAGGSWTEAVLHNFGSIPSDGSNPVAALTLTPSGALIGTTEAGGTNKSFGVIFALSPPSSPGGQWHYGIPHRFTGGADGWSPQSRLTLLPGKNPIIYGTTTRGGTTNEGTVYQLIPPPPGGNWTETPVYNFTGGSDGGRPQGGVIVRGFALYGTTTDGGTHGQGTAFRLSQ